MKKILLLSCTVLWSITGFGQKKPSDPCGQIFKTQYDKFDKKKTRVLRNPISLSWAGKPIQVDLMATESGTKILSLSIMKGIHCIEANSEMEFLFEDDFTLTFTNSNKFNCEGTAAIFFFNDNECTKFARDKLKSIRFRTTKSVITLDLPKAKSVQILKAFSCLIPE